MPGTNPLVGEVTRPESFDPDLDYALVVVRGGNRKDVWVGDYDLCDAQRIFREDLALLMRALLRDGAVLFETGGVIGQPVVGVGAGGDDALASAGAYVGIESQLYTVLVTDGGQADGTGAGARYTWKATGADSPQFAGTKFPVRAIAKDLATAQADPATYGHAVGRLGVLVYFLNPNGFLTAGNTWVVQVTYGAQAPAVSGDLITLGDCLVPVAGRLHRVRGATLVYPHATTGVQTVYGEWTRTVVDHIDNPNLTDPDSDTPQAWRERWQIVLRTTDTSATSGGVKELQRRVFALYQWDRATDLVTPVIPAPYAINLAKTEGSLDAARLLNVDQNELLRGLLADLVFSALGGYVTEPLPPQPRATVSANAPTAGKIRLALPKITARPAGVPVRLERPSEIEVDQALETALVTSESHQYLVATANYLLTKASAFPIAATIVKLLATVQVGTGSGGSGTGWEAKTRGGTAYDALAHNPIVALDSISSTAGGGGTVYTQGTHYELAADAGQLKVHWITGGPSGGATYYIKYKYTKTMVQGTDFALVGAGAITFATLAGDDPVDTTTFTVDYNYFLPRHDTLMLRPTGEMAVLRGIPAEQPDIAPLPQGVLAYARVEVAPNSSQVVIRGFRNDRVTFEQINLLIEEVSEIKRNVAELDLVGQARAKTAANLLDMFVDNFDTLAQGDPSYSTGGHTFDATVDIDKGQLTLPFNQALAALAKAGTFPSGETDVRVGGDYWTLPFTHELAIASDRYSFARKVNAYTDFRPPTALLRVQPSQDFSVDTTVTTDSETRVVQAGNRRARTPQPQAVGGIDTSIQATLVPSVFMRTIQVALTGFHLVPGEKVRVKFAGQDVAFLADAPSAQVPAGLGNAANEAVQANPAGGAAGVVAGEVTGHIVVPANIPTGTVAIELWGDSGVPGAVWPAGYAQRSVSQFTSTGVVRNYAVEQVITIFPLPRPRAGGSPMSGVMLDPIAQSVLFATPRMLSRVDVPLAAKPAGTQGAPLIAEIRNTDRSGRASTPTSEVLASQTLEQRDLAVGPTSSNVVTFRDPVYVPAQEFRALVLRTPSSEYQAYVAEVGGPDLVSGGFIETQQIPDGLLMDSEDNADWTFRQGQDLRAKFYVAHMSALEARLYLGRITAGGAIPADMTALLVSPDQVVPDGTSIEWQYSIDGVAIAPGSGKVWTTFLPYVLAEFPTITQTVDVRAILRTTDPYVTPAIHFRNLAAHVQANKASGKYIGRSIALTAAATKVKGTLRYVAPDGDAPPDVYVSCNDGADWTQVTLDSAGTGVDTRTGVVSKTFAQTTGITSGSALRTRIDLLATTTNHARRPIVASVLAWTEP